MSKKIIEVVVNNCGECLYVKQHCGENMCGHPTRTQHQEPVIDDLSETLHDCPLEDHETTLMRVVQVHERQGLAACNFFLEYRTDSDKPVRMKFQSPPWNWQGQEDFRKSAIATGMVHWGVLNGQDVTLVGREPIKEE